MTSRIRRLSKVLLALCVACTLAALAAWGILLTTFCSDPRAPMPATQHVIPYNCHGMTVFISPLEDALRVWLIPLGMLFICLSMLAAVAVVLAHAKVRTDVRIVVERREGG